MLLKKILLLNLTIISVSAMSISESSSKIEKFRVKFHPYPGTEKSCADIGLAGEVGFVYTMGPDKRSLGINAKNREVMLVATTFGGKFNIVDSNHTLPYFHDTARSRETACSLDISTGEFIFSEVTFTPELTKADSNGVVRGTPGPHKVATRIFCRALVTFPLASDWLRFARLEHLTEVAN